MFALSLTTCLIHNGNFIWNPGFLSLNRTMKGLKLPFDLELRVCIFDGRTKLGC